MKVNVDDNAKMRAALSLANRGRYLEALPLFAQVNTYESALNQIACLCMMDEDGYASDLYRQTKQKYGFTHALYADALTFGNALSTVLDFCEPDREFARLHDGELCADKNLLLDIFGDFDDDAYYDDEPSESFFSAPPFNPSQSFYDVNSAQYVQSLRAKFENALMEEDEKAVRELYKTALSLSRTDLDALELKLALITVRQKYKGKEALAVAKKLADCEGGSMLAKGAALQIVLDNNPHKNIDVLAKLVRKLLSDAEKIGAAELAELVFTANDVLNDSELAYQYAKALYAKKDSMILDDYKVCATAFFNHGDLDLAKGAILTLSRYVPADPYVAFWLEFIQNASYKTAALQIGERTARHFFVPYAAMSYVNAIMGQRVLSDNMTLDADALRYVNVLFMYVKSLMIVGENNKYHEMSAYVRAILHTVPPTDNQLFFDFAVKNLLTMINDYLLNQTLLTRLMELGFDKKVFVGQTETYRVLDFAEIPKEEQMLYMPLSIALSISGVSCRNLVAAYYIVKPLINGEEFSLALAHNIAYAMLCIASPSFRKTDDAEFFAESEKELYARYRSGCST